MIWGIPLHNKTAYGEVTEDDMMQARLILSTLEHIGHCKALGVPVQLELTDLDLRCLAEAADIAKERHKQLNKAKKG